MSSIRYLLPICAVAASALISVSAAQATTVVTFPMNSSGTGGNAGRIYTTTVGSTTVKVRVTGWSTTPTTVEKGAVKVYGNGLGVTSVGEPTTDPHHTIDNEGGKTDFLILQFDQQVELEAAKFTTYKIGSTKYDGDATIAFGYSNGSWMTDPLAATSTSAQLAALFGNSFAASNVPSTGGQTAVTRSLNGSNKVGNIWLIGAAFTNPVENCGTKNNKLCYDGFKLSQVAVQTAVPEPATWMMMILGFGFIGGALRRRKAPALLAAA